MAISIVSCSNSIKIHSYPSSAKVYIKDIITNTKQELGQTPLNITRTDEMSDVFFISIEKDDFLTREILVKSGENESIFIDAKLEPQEEKLLAEQLGLKNTPVGPGAGGKGKDRKKQVKEQETQIKEMETKIALLNNTLGMYKDALFSQRYAGGDRFRARDNDKVVKLLFNAQKYIMGKKYTKAKATINKALQMDEYLSQAYILKGSIYYIGKSYAKARLNWERALEIDPYNAEVLKYLKRLYRKLGIPQRKAIKMAEGFKKSRRPASTK